MLYALLLAAATTLAPVANSTAAWLNAAHAPVTAGRVTVVDIFTFGCLNCKHVTPQLKQLRAAIPEDELAIVGVHAPETPYERDRANVRDALRDQNITWPVVIDNDFAIWKAYGVDAWPTQLVFDRHGKLRATYVGEGNDSELERSVRALIAERS
jgi:thiol-disulfide isomerase/thioredoxin